jgi:hypothetical protein
MKRIVFLLRRNESVVPFTGVPPLE